MAEQSRDTAGTGWTGEIAREQRHLDRLYDRVDELRTETAAELARAWREVASTGRELVEREARVDRLTARVTTLDRAENGLCFGRLDLADGQTRYVGRTGLRAPAPERTPLLLDWRAPGARAFYAATPADPQQVVRRRHLRTERRRVTSVEDEILDVEALDSDRLGGAQAVQGEGALLAALAERRTGRMRDIVTTLQAEQDEIVRAAAEGVLVVQGGPGTGKTAVALHRAAYLLYARPEIARQGVLVVGPSAAFLDYIEQVLPALGETQVVLTTPEMLLPGVRPAAAEAPEVARLKGEAVMAEVLARAVRERQRVVDLEIRYDGDLHRVPAAAIRQAGEEARRAARPHNEARRVFRRRVLRALALEVIGAGYRLLQDVEEGLEEELARADSALARAADQVPGRVEAAGTEVDGVAGAHEVALVERELLEDALVAEALEELWPALTPEDLLDGLYARPELLASASRGLLDENERLLLRRDAGSPWSPADVPLLDEAAELLGVDDAEERGREVARRREHARFARQVLRSHDLVPEESEETAPGALLGEEELAHRHAERDHRSFAEKAAADRAWTYGHVVVDEAQELSAMTWRALFRRCPAGSMTVVGDVHQGSGPTAASSWELALQPHTRARVRLRELTVGYRTPAEVMAAAEPVLHALDPAARPPRSVRSTGEPALRVPVSGDLVAAVAAEISALAGRGAVAVIAAEPLQAQLRAGLGEAGDVTELRRELVVLGARESKGLEFDAVILVEPAAILAAPRGLSELYVAMTRTTGALRVLHTGEVPAVLAHLPAPTPDAGPRTGDSPHRP